jgi:hypothetical protein
MLMSGLHPDAGKISNWNNGCVDRIVDIITDYGTQWDRSGNRYRDHVAGSKY